MLSVTRCPSGVPRVGPGALHPAPGGALSGRNWGGSGRNCVENLKVTCPSHRPHGPYGVLKAVARLG